MKPRAAFPLALAAALTIFAAAPSHAQQKPSPSRTVVITLGTAGGPLPRANRAQASNLLVVNGTPYLIDAGDGAVRRIVRAGYDYRQISKIFIPHAHSAHPNGLATLLNAQWEDAKREPTDVYGGGMEALVKGAIAFLQPNADVRWNEGKRVRLDEMYRGHDVTPGVIYQDANVRVTAVENTHFNFPPESPAHGKYRSYSYRFDTPGRVVVFTGDTGPSDALTQLSKGADVLVTEVNVTQEVIDLQKRNGSWQAKSAAEQEAWIRHMNGEHVTPEQIGRMASAAGVKMVVLTHFTPTVNRNDDYQRFVAATKKVYPGQVLLAKDLMQF